MPPSMILSGDKEGDWLSRKTNRRLIASRGIGQSVTSQKNTAWLFLNLLRARNEMMVAERAASEGRRRDPCCFLSPTHQAIGRISGVIVKLVFKVSSAGLEKHFNVCCVGSEVSFGKLWGRLSSKRQVILMSNQGAHPSLPAKPISLSVRIKNVCGAL